MRILRFLKRNWYICGLVFLWIVVATAGMLLGYSPPKKQIDNTANLVGCEVTAATVEKELEETRYKMSLCEYAVENLCNYVGLEKCKEILTRPVN